MDSVDMLLSQAYTEAMDKIAHERAIAEQEKRLKKIVRPKLHNIKSIVLPTGDISTNGHNLWVNASDGGCVARFGLQVAEVYPKDNTIQSRPILFNCAGVNRLPAWNTFKGLVKQYYHIDIPDNFHSLY